MFNFLNALERRKSNRHQVKGVKTRFGEVMNLSQDGALIYRKGSLNCTIGDPLALVIHHRGKEIEITGSIVWTQQVGLRRYEVGVNFKSADPPTREQIDFLIETASQEYSPIVYVGS